MQQVIGRNAIGAQTYTTTLQTKRLGCPMKKTHVQNLQGRMLAENTFSTNTFWQSTLGRVSCQGYPWQGTLAHKKLISKWLPFSKVYVCITAYRKKQTRMLYSIYIFISQRLGPKLRSARRVAP